MSSANTMKKENQISDCDLTVPLAGFSLAAVLADSVRHSIHLLSQLPMKCPYFQCNEETSRRFSGAVHRCESCWRLSIRCEKPKCNTLNRPLERFCRRCGDNMLEDNWEATAQQQWEWARLFGPECPRWSKSEAGRELATRDVGNLSNLSFYRRPESLIAFDFFEGVLVIHQPGAYVGFLHPFLEDSDIELAKIWVEAEKLRSPDETRAFPPKLMSDRRHVLFSTPYAVFGVDIWSLPDWGSDGEEVVYKTLVDTNAPEQPKIVSEPIILPNQQFGLLTRDAKKNYGWSVFDLAPMRSREPFDTTTAAPLPITGDMCAVEAIEGRAIVFSSPMGHWVWKLQDAIRSNVSEMVQTWPHQDGKRGESLEMSEDVEHSRAFRKPTQFINLRRKDGKTITMYYRVKSGQEHRLDCYSIELDTLKRRGASTLADNGHPLGTVERGPWDVLIACKNTLRCDNDRQLEDFPNHGPIENIDEVTGLVYRDPLLITISRGRSSDRSVAIRSLNHPTNRITIDLPTLLANPVMWSSWLFTIELTDAGTLVLRRRSLTSQSPEKLDVGHSVSA